MRMVASSPDPRYRSEARTERKEPSMSIAMKPPRATVADAAVASHPLAGAAMNGADMIVQVLADEGVDTIFCYSGGAGLPAPEGGVPAQGGCGRPGRDRPGLRRPGPGGGRLR